MEQKEVLYENNKTRELNEKTKTALRNGDALLNSFYGAVYDYLMDEKVNKKAMMNKTVSKAIANLGESSLLTIQKVIKDTSAYFAPDAIDDEFIEFRINRRLFPWQQHVLRSTSKKITLQCGRRTGKSFAEAYLAVNHCSRGFDVINGFSKTRRVAIVGLTIEKCADVFWNNLKQAAEISDMAYKADNSKYTLSFQNGSSIQLFGNNSKAEREKLRGTEFSFIVIDEAQSQGSLGYLLEDIFGAIITGRDSTIILSGTGSLTGYGPWVDFCNDPRWQHFRYNMSDNPSIPIGALEKVLEDNGWTKDNITYRREYLAEHVVDTTRMVIPKWHHYDLHKSDTDLYKSVFTGAIIGIDYGFEDNNALCGLVFDEKNNKVYVVAQDKFNHAGTDEILKAAQKMEEWISEKFKVKALFVADNSNQTVSIDLHRRGLHITNAYKVDKLAQLTNLREAMANGTIELVKTDYNDKDFVEDEIKQTVWKWDEEKKSVIYEIDDDYYHPDILDALRYAYTTYKMKYRK